MYQPKIGDDVTFAAIEINRDVVYTVTEVNDVEITVTTPKGYGDGDDVFTYILTVGQFGACGPQPLERPSTV